MVLEALGIVVRLVADHAPQEVYVVWIMVVVRHAGCGAEWMKNEVRISEEEKREERREKIKKNE